MTRFKLVIEYDGGPFVGWQKQQNGPSIQATLEEAIRQFSGEEVSVTGGGRTDTGVHALGQVAHIDLTRIITADKLREAIGNAGGGKIGNYTYCSFSVKGIGRFLPTDGAMPAIGQVGRLEEVAEERIEITCDSASAKSVVDSIRATHSYEEPVIDIYELKEL